MHHEPDPLLSGRRRPPLRLIVAGRVCDVWTRHYYLRGERRSAKWVIEIVPPGDDEATALVTWTGIHVGETERPFSAAYLVSADETSFEVRLDAQGGAYWCQLHGDARTNGMRAMLCATSADAVDFSLRGNLGEDRVVPNVVRAGYRLRPGPIRGGCRRAGGSLILEADAAEPMTGDAPLHRGYVLAEMELVVEDTTTT